MKRGRLPLTALRSFEAAARHESFSRAAEELHVSQAAISRQVRELEELLGTPLFERLHRKVVLTSPGRRLAEELTRALDGIDRRLTEIAAGAARTTVRVSVEPSFAGCWLVSRLPDFQLRHPDVDILIDADHRLVEFRGGEVDIAIRHSVAESRWPRVEAEMLAQIAVSPVLSPQLLAAGPELELPTDLLACVLLHEENRDGWSRWFASAGVADEPPGRGPIFTDGALAMQAARLGHGVALADQLMMDDDVAEGRLLQPFPITVGYGAYYLIAPDLARLDAPVRAFADWLRNELASSGEDAATLSRD